MGWLLLMVGMVIADGRQWLLLLMGSMLFKSNYSLTSRLVG